MKKNIYIFGGGGPWGGALHQTQGYHIFRTLRLHHRADICITMEKQGNSVARDLPQTGSET